MYKVLGACLIVLNSRTDHMFFLYHFFLITQVIYSQFSFEFVCVCACAYMIKHTVLQVILTSPFPCSDFYNTETSENEMVSFSDVSETHSLLYACAEGQEVLLILKAGCVSTQLRL